VGGASGSPRRDSLSCGCSGFTAIFGSTTGGVTTAPGAAFVSGFFTMPGSCMFGEASGALGASAVGGSGLAGGCDGNRSAAADEVAPVSATAHKIHFANLVFIFILQGTSACRLRELGNPQDGCGGRSLLSSRYLDKAGENACPSQDNSSVRRPGCMSESHERQQRFGGPALARSSTYTA
jgi:hypothetical protein